MLRGHYKTQYALLTVAILVVVGAFIVIDWAAGTLQGVSNASLSSALSDAVLGAVAAALLADLLFWIMTRSFGRIPFVSLITACLVQVVVTTASWTVAADGSLNPGDRSIPAFSWACLILTSPLIFLRLITLGKIMTGRRASGPDQ
jgi:hypothetical protein